MQMRIHRNMKKILASLFAVILILSLAAFGSSGNNTQNTENNANTNEPSNTVQPENTTPSNSTESSADKGNEATGNSILVVYFSWSGHLDSMAHWVADETGGDLYRVTAKDPYPTDYNQTADRAKSEQDNDVRPEIVIETSQKSRWRSTTPFSSDSRFGGMTFPCPCGPSWKAMISRVRRSSCSSLMRAARTVPELCLPSKSWRREQQ